MYMCECRFLWNLEESALSPGAEVRQYMLGTALEEHQTFLTTKPSLKSQIYRALRRIQSCRTLALITHYKAN